MHLFRLFSKSRFARLSLTFVLSLLVISPAHAKVVVFWQPGFPTISSEPLTVEVLNKSLDGMQPLYSDEASLRDPATLGDAELLVLPYGSAVPVAEWKVIEHYLHAGGNLLVIGGQPLYVPVSGHVGAFKSERAQDTYARALDFRHTYRVPVTSTARFSWRSGFDLGEAPSVRAKQIFTVEGNLEGLGYMTDPSGVDVAAPVILSDHHFENGPTARIVALNFDPEQGYWESSDGVALIRESAQFARQRPISIAVESLYSAIRPGESPSISIHLRMSDPHVAGTDSGVLKLTLNRDNQQLDSVSIPVQWSEARDVIAPFHSNLSPGFYTVSAVYSQNHEFRTFHQNGFWVQPASTLGSGPVLGVRGDFLTRDGKPFFPVGTNYFSTESNGWDFSGPRNAAVWERDFAEMEKSSINFVRTGVWMPYGGLVGNIPGDGVSERFLRNLEAFLLSAQRHHIAVNFTFFAFAPRFREAKAEDAQTPANPYLDPEALRPEEAYVRSIVERFKGDRDLSWDLINEPSFSNPRVIFRGNVPNGDPVELAAWREWLKTKYGNDVASLAAAWAAPAEQLSSFEDIPLPARADLTYDRYGNAREVRAVDYNLFAQQMFANWVQRMIQIIRSTGSEQLVDVGQDEGGVTDRVLNQFYGGAGVSFTTNHTYWQDDALLWDSVAAKRPGVPNITGETGYQPVWAPDGTWRYDEFTGLGLTERKWALGFAAGSSGAVQWDWDREPDFGMKRSDGSAKVWQTEIRRLGEFAQKAAPFATEMRLPEVAIVLPQSLQLSVYNSYAIEAQQAAVRALYAGAHASAYAVGEYQIDLLGRPKLIILPSAYGLTDEAWKGILAQVKSGATLLVTGPFDADAHLHSTGRQNAVGLAYGSVPLTLRESTEHFPWGTANVVFAGGKATTLSRAELPNGAVWKEVQAGQGRILFCALPLELSDSPEVLRDAYEYALKVSNVSQLYTSESIPDGILLAPTEYPQATQYVITSESNQKQVSFTDRRSGKRFSGSLEPGTAALLLVGTDGKLLSTYRWPDPEH